MKKQFASVCLLILAISSQAQIAFNTFGPGDATKAFGWGFGDIRDARAASQFTSMESGTLSDIVLKLQGSSTAASATISLFHDSGNDIGTLLTNFTTVISTGGMTTFTNTDPNVKLISGNKYWIEAKTTTVGSGLYSGWFVNSQGIKGPFKFGNVGGTSLNPNSTYNVGNAFLRRRKG
jgi:hypothetical protein